MSSDLSEGQNFLLGTFAAFIEGILLQPTLYWKNARAQNLPFTLNPVVLYRGTAASIFNECQMMGLQFGVTGYFRKALHSTDIKILKKYEDVVSTAFGGIFPAFLVSPVELIMIQQQRFGGSFISNSLRVMNNHGFSSSGVMRGVLSTTLRDSIYVTGMLGVTPLYYEILKKKYGFNSISAGFYSSLLGGIFAAIPSHPFDVIKTCMQGDLKKEKYKGFIRTSMVLWREGGLNRVFSGCMWRTINITATVYVANECRVVFSPYFSTLGI